MPPIGDRPDTSQVPGQRWDVPHGQPAGSSLITGRRRLRSSGIFDAAGRGEVNLGSPPVGGWWLVDRIVIRTTSTVQTTATVFVGEISNASVEDSTPTGNLDVADYPRGLYVAGGADLIVEWVGGDPGTSAFASAQVAEERNG